MYWVLLLIAALVGTHGLRTWLLKRPLKAVNHEPFDGAIYQVGDSVIGYRAAQGKPRRSVIAVHGFLEDFRYFTALYMDPTVELVLINNSGYHCPDRSQAPHQAPWAQSENPYPVGSIEHDAFVFNLALTHLVSGESVRAHGHSRGGAVILEAAAQAPERFRDIDVILEAPVLPGGKGHPLLELAFNGLGRYLLPINFSLLRHIDTVRFGGWMFAPLNPRKAELVRGLYFSARSFDVVLSNIRSMRAWIETRDASLYGNLSHGVILIGARDLVLDRGAMLRSAKHAEPHLKVVETHGTSHFISLDQPATVPKLTVAAA
ncbi:MAG: alpha/beta hydrolase [Pseudomonadota bacterium]|nr:alpha/beta hydrolase [Pseudomonadota bacterium]